MIIKYLCNLDFMFSGTKCQDCVILDSWKRVAFVEEFIVRKKTTEGAGRVVNVIVFFFSLQTTVCLCMHNQIAIICSDVLSSSSSHKFHSQWNCVQPRAHNMQRREYQTLEYVCGK